MARDPEKERKWQRVSYQRNREKILARKKAKYDAAKKSKYNSTEEARASRKASYHKHKSKHIARVRARKQNLGSVASLTEEQWQSILQRFGSKCLRCGTTEGLTKDHVVPLSKGGTDNPENIQPLCRPCNSKKGTSETDYRYLTQP